MAGDKKDNTRKEASRNFLRFENGGKKIRRKYSFFFNEIVVMIIVQPMKLLLRVRKNSFNVSFIIITYNNNKQQIQSNNWKKKKETIIKVIRIMIRMTNQSGTRRAQQVQTTRTEPVKTVFPEYPRLAGSGCHIYHSLSRVRVPSRVNTFHQDPFQEESPRYRAVNRRTKPRCSLRSVYLAGRRIVTVACTRT